MFASYCKCVSTFSHFVIGSEPLTNICFEMAKMISFTKISTSINIAKIVTDGLQATVQWYYERMQHGTCQGRKLTFLGRRQLVTDLFFSVAKWENVATSCEILVASAKILVALATREAQFLTLHVCALCQEMWV